MIFPLVYLLVVREHLFKRKIKNYKKEIVADNGKDRNHGKWSLLIAPTAIQFGETCHCILLNSHLNWIPNRKH